MRAAVIVDTSPPKKSSRRLRREIEAGSLPMLARLLDVSDDPIVAKEAALAAAQSQAGYRIDSHLTGEQTWRGSTAFIGKPRESMGDRHASTSTLRSELVFAPKRGGPPRPHLFERSRTVIRPAREQGRFSPMSSQSSLQAAQRRRLIELLAPALRFIVLAALFTAAGTWVQMTAFRKQGVGNTNQPVPSATSRSAPTAAATAPTAAAIAPAPSTAPATPTTNANTSNPSAEQTPSAQETSSGPVSRVPTAPSHVAQPRSDNGFAQLSGGILPLASDATDAANLELPRVQMAEQNASAARSDVLAPASDSGGSPEIARSANFQLNAPTR